MSGVKEFANGFSKGMRSFGDNISLIVNSVLLSVAYFLGVGLTAIVAKVAGKNFLEKKTSSEAKSYWSDLNLKKKEFREYYRQF